MLRLLVLWLNCLAGPLYAHITEGGLAQEIVVEERFGPTRIWVRVPLPLVFADRIAAAGVAGEPLSSPFLYLEQTGAGPRYRVATDEIATQPEAFAARLAGFLVLSRNGEALVPKVTATRLSARWPRTRFDSPDDARISVAAPDTELNPIFGQAVVEFAMTVPRGPGALTLASGYPPLPLAPGVTIATHVTHNSLGTEPVMIYRPGQLAREIVLLEVRWHTARALPWALSVLIALALLWPASGLLRRRARS